MFSFYFWILIIYCIKVNDLHDMKRSLWKTEWSNEEEICLINPFNFWARILNNCFQQLLEKKKPVAGLRRCRKPF